MTNNYLKGIGGEPINSKGENMSIKDAQKMRKYADVVIIETHCGIEIIRGIRAGLIKSSYELGTYKKTNYHWPVKEGRHFINIAVLCNMKTGEYSLVKGGAVEEVKNNIPQGFEIEFLYSRKPKVKKEVKKIEENEVKKEVKKPQIPKINY